MKTFIIAALTADGFIARHSRHLPDWTSKEDKEFFAQKTKEAGVVVMGLNTYKTIGKPLPGRHNIVYAPASLADGPLEQGQFAGVEITQDDPKVLLAKLEQKGFAQLAICGGATIYTLFMEAGVVDSLYLTVEPILFGKGMPLFTRELNARLALLNTKRLNEHTVLLEYSILNTQY